MATKLLVTKVWIEEGCIVCDACENAAPDVFEVQDETCVIRPEALDAEFNKPRSQSIVDAAEECPVDVIKFETVAVEVADAQPVGQGEAESDVEVPAPTPPKQAAKAPASAPPPVPPAKAPAKPRPQPAVAAASAPATADGDLSIQELLKAAASRGGSAGLAKKNVLSPQTVESWNRKKPDELPADARLAKVFEEARKSAKEPDKKRRSVTGGAALTLGWVAFGGGAGISIGPALGRFMMPNVLEEPDPRIRVGKLQKYVEMQPGEVNEDYKPEGVWMIREEGRIAALSIICTHLGCIPNWLPNDRKFKCPCHGSGYKFNGINFEGPTPRPLERFRVLVNGGMVVVDKSKKYQYELGQWDMPGSYLDV